jgi:hypothetical protein
MARYQERDTYISLACLPESEARMGKSTDWFNSTRSLYYFFFYYAKLLCRVPSNCMIGQYGQLYVAWYTSCDTRHVFCEQHALLIAIPTALIAPRQRPPRTVLC